MTLRTFIKLWAPQATHKTGAQGAWNMGHHRRPKFFSFLLPPPEAAQNGTRLRPKRDAKGDVTPEGERNPAEGGSSRVLYKFIYLCTKCIFTSVTATEGALYAAPTAPFPRRAREILPKAGVSRVLYKYLRWCIKDTNDRFDTWNDYFKSNKIGIRATCNREIS